LTVVPERLREVKEALFRVGVTGMTLSRVSGHGGEREIVEHYRGSALVLEFREKVKIEAAVSEPFVEPTIRAIVEAARTGEVGDGKIFVQELERVIRIRTGESDVAALTPVTADMVSSSSSPTKRQSRPPPPDAIRRASRPPRSSRWDPRPACASRSRR
jgi:nitrogen regulatory protein P-II 1